MGAILNNVTDKNDAFRALVMAVELQAVLDYRDALYENTFLKDSEYITYRSPTIIECERFFNDVGFVPYEMLREKVIQFKKCIDEIKKKPEMKDVETFECPICGGTASIRTTRKSALRLKPNVPRFENAKQVSCEGCHFKVFI